MDFLVSLVGRTLLNLKTFLDGTEMMEDSIILCEGSSDFVLLQYYMRTVYGWTDERTQNIRLDSIKRSRTLKKDENLLTIR